MGQDDCSALADCQNTEGSFVCLCKDGFLDDGARGRQCEGRNINYFIKHGYNTCLVHLMITDICLHEIY